MCKQEFLPVIIIIFMISQYIHQQFARHCIAIILTLLPSTLKFILQHEIYTLVLAKLTIKTLNLIR